MTYLQGVYFGGSMERKIKNLNFDEQEELVVKSFGISKYFLAIVLMASVMCSGCIYIVVGGIGAVGGYIVSPDTVEGITENDKELVWATAAKMISLMGLVQEENKDGGILVASVNGAKVVVTVVPLSPTTTKVIVKARKAYLPRIALAQDIFVKIMDRLGE
jgi:hypothetical protein